MSDWQGRGMPSAGRGKDTPRFKPLVIAGPIAAVLLFTTLTGHVDLIGAMSPESAKIERVILERAILQATAQAQTAETNAAPQTALVVTATPSVSPAPSEGVAAAGCGPSGDARFCLYTIEEGDSLAAIATRFGLDGGEVPGWELLYESNKEDLAGLEEVLIPGWVLRVPLSEAVLHLVLPGDSVSAVAADYGVTTESIVEANGLADPDNVQIGDILLVPSPSQAPVVLPPEPIAEEEPEELPAGEDEIDQDGASGDATEEEGEGEEPEEEEQDESDGSDAEEQDPSEDTDAEDAPEEATPHDGGDEQDGSPDEGDDVPDDGDGDEDEAGSEEDAGAEEESQPEADDASSMSWPVVQPLRITNYMSARHPLGMDFGLFYAPTSPILAAAGGTVSFAGGDPCCSYGYYVIVDHGNGLQTLYAHLSSIAVGKGDVVGRGDSLGIAGNTGNSRGVHLHFEVYREGKRVDPMLFLPRD